jgi:hypothetical protein
MKKYLIVVLLLVAGFNSNAHTVKNINENLIRTFKETYPNAVQVSWKEYSETYVVYFVQEGIRINLIFKKDGSFVSSLRYYKEDYLPYYLLAKVREKYPEKKFYSVTEISSPNSIEYFIKLQDAKNWITLKVDSDGNMKEVEKFRKA